MSTTTFFIPPVNLIGNGCLKDACGLTNPRPASQADIEAIFRGAM